MNYPTSQPFIDRKEQRKLIEELLQQAQKREVHFSAVEFYGIGGLGKSRVLDQAKERCRALGLPFAVVEFLLSDSCTAQVGSVDTLLRICDQLDHYASLSPARASLTSLLRNSKAHGAEQDDSKPKPVTESEEQVLARFRIQLSQAIQNNPLILMFDSVEHCPDELFDWLGRSFLAPLLEENGALSLLVFIAGRGPRISDSRWPGSITRSARSLRLDPFDFKATQDHIASLSPDGRYQTASREIYSLSSGHAYSNEAIVNELNELGVKVEEVGVQRERLAQQLYQQVIHRYILSDAQDWALPLLEMASIPRRFDPWLLLTLVSQYQPQLAPNQPIQWYVARLVDLQRDPLHLVYPGQGRPAYELDPTLRRLLHTAQVILNPRQTVAIHGKLQTLYEEMLSPASGPTVSSAAIIVEILYHAAQVAAIQSEAAEEPVIARMAELVKSFRPARPRDVQELNLLKDLIGKDKDLADLLTHDAVIKLQRIVDERLNTLPPPVASFQFSHLVIEHFPPSQYRVSWYQANQVLLPTEQIRTVRRFSLQEWRSDTLTIGRTAFRNYLPRRAQEFVRSHQDLAIQLGTNWTEIPWELLHDGAQFLCLSRPIARKPSLLKEPQEHVRKQEGPFKALVIGNPTGDLPGAEREAERIAQILKESGALVDLLIGKERATAKQFILKISNVDYDLIHFAGHGYFDPSTPELAGLCFSDGPAYGEELERNLISPAFVFLSTCFGAETKTETSTFGFRGELIEGLAISALLGGAIGCLAPMWEIEDGVAQEFAIEFYEQVKQKVPIGEAVRQARLAVCENTSDAWASWVLYGQPLDILPLFRNK